MHKKLKLIHKLIIPPISAFLIGILFVSIIITKMHTSQEAVHELEETLIPALEKSTTNNTQIKNISEKFIFAVLASETDMLPSVDDANTIENNLKSIIGNKKLKLSQYKETIIYFKQYFSIALQQAKEMIHNTDNITNSNNALQITHLYNRVKNDFYHIHIELNNKIVTQTKRINTITNQIITFTVVFILIFSSLLFIISYIIYHGFHHKFNALQKKLSKLDVVSKKHKYTHLTLDELTEISDRISDKIEQFDTLKKEKKEIENIAERDPLTGLYNRRYIEKIETFIQKHKPSFGLILLDIDFFKKVNDTYGHNVGDTILIEFSNILKTNTRKDDIVIRYGGEEFLIIFQNISKETLLLKAENLRKSIEKAHFTHVNKMTASLGVALNKKENNIHTTIKYADIALYRAKDSGRNNVQYYSNQNKG
jgi:diguanylate cyclase (GGDEF)-like protein